MIYTTSLEVSQRIKELIGEQTSEFYLVYDNETGQEVNVCWKKELIVFAKKKENRALACFTLSELAPVLKKIGEKAGWVHTHACPTCKSDEYHDMEYWHYNYVKICELVGTGQEDEADRYLLELLK